MLQVPGRPKYFERWTALNRPNDEVKEDHIRVISYLMSKILTEEQEMTDPAFEKRLDPTRIVLLIFTIGEFNLLVAVILKEGHKRGKEKTQELMKMSRLVTCMVLTNRTRTMTIIRILDNHPHVGHDIFFLTGNAPLILSLRL